MTRSHHRTIRLAGVAGFVLAVIGSIVTDGSAATYHVSKTGSNSNSCSAAQDPDTPKLTIASALGCESAGDTVLIGDGTYVENNLHTLITPGASSSARTTLKAINRRQVIIAPNGGDRVFLFTARPNIALIGLVLDASGVNNNVVRIDTGSINILIDDCELRDSSNSAILTGDSPGGIVRNTWIHNNGVTGLSHGIYLNSGSDNWVIEHNWIEGHSGYAIQMYREPKNTLFQFNFLTGSCIADGSGKEITVGHQNNIIRYNIFSVGPSCNQGIQQNYYGPSGNTFSHNSLYCEGGTCPIGIHLVTGVNTKVQNNAIPGFSTAVSNGASGTTLTTNLTSGTASNIYQAPGSGDLSLKAGSAAINAGTNIGLPFSGSAPDQGAFESFSPTSGTLNLNQADITFDAIYPPVEPVSGATGWSVTCVSGTCPSPLTVLSVNKLVGSDTTLRVVISGFPSNACSAGYTIGLSFNASTGTVRDSINVGGGGPNPVNQKAFSFTSFPITNNCSGGGGGGGGGGSSTAPGSPHIHYKADDNVGTTLLNDGTGGTGLNGSIVGGGGWGPGFFNTGIVLSANSSQAGAVAYGSGVNPTTTSLTIAWVVAVTASQVNTTCYYGGTSLGTDQRLYVRTVGGTWGLGVQASPYGSAISDLPVTEGWHVVILRVDKDTPGSGTGTATLCIDGVCSNSAGAKKTYTSYTLASNWDWGKANGLTSGCGGTYDEFLLYENVSTSVQSIYEWFVPPSANTAFSQVATRFQLVHEQNGAPVDLGSALNQSQDVQDQGGVVFVTQVECDDCVQSAFKLQYKKDGLGDWANVPDTETAAGIWMWGVTSDPNLNAGIRSSRLTGSCTMVQGWTVTTSTQSNTVDLPANGCTVEAFVVRVGGSTAFFDLRLVDHNNIPFSGTYQLGRVYNVGPKATGAQ